VTAFRTLLVVLLLVLASYTAVVVVNHGLGLLPVFFGDIATMGWPGQFNLDFMCLLVLSAFWVAWRHHFTVPGIALGFLALVAGSLFLTAYLFVVSGQARGDMREVLLGRARAAAV
jgi:hypothetical protein